MKAFGVRLAAGAVTILLGAIMAAQAQKDQQASTESAWTEQQIPPGKAAAPIGINGDSDPQDSWNGEALPEIEDAQPLKSSVQGDVTLVQHTEPVGMGLPSDGGQTGASPQDDSGIIRAPKMRMRLPSFEDGPSLVDSPAESSDAAAASTPSSAYAEAGHAEGNVPAASGDDAAASTGPAFAMGLPIEAEPAAEEVPDPQAPPKMSGVRFADTPDPALEAASADAGNLPSNDLRSVAGLQVADDTASAAPGAFDAGQGFSIEYADDTASDMPAPQLPSRGFADSVDPTAGKPAAMLSAVLPGGEAEAAPAEEPSATTMRIHREPPVQIQIGGQAPSQADLANQPMASSAQTPAPASTAPQFASQPRLMPLPNADAAEQLQGFQQLPSGTGSAAPMQIPSDTPGNLAAPQLPPGQYAQQGPAYEGQNVSAPPPSTAMAQASAQALSQGVQGQGYPGPDYPGPDYQGQGSGSIYQGVGYKQTSPPRDLQAASLTMATPGERTLDGPQSPSVVIHKRAPEEVKVGKPASFVITVKNIGGAVAQNVQVFDRVPTGMTLTDATPRPDPQYQPELFWDLGDLEPNQERTITLQLTPEQEGELGSVARVTFQAAASVRTISTRPELKVVQKAPPKVPVGQLLEIELEVSNPGTGEATGVLLQEDVPDGLQHPQGKQLDNMIGTLGPGEIRRQILRMRAVKPGIIENQIRVKADDGLETTHTVAVEVIAPQLKVALSGPSKRYLERQATYELEIANVGTDDAQNVELSVQLDRGFTFVKTDYEGQYDPTRHAVFWSLPTLPVGKSGTVPLTLLPVQEGKRVMRTEATADMGVQNSIETEVFVDSLAELTFSISDTADPIEVGGQTTYEIRIQNTGSRDDTNVKVALQLPNGLQLVEQGDYTAQGQGVVAFSPRALLKANDEMVFRVKAQGVAPGRHLVKAIVTSDQSSLPVTKEESIMVYSDQ